MARHQGREREWGHAERCHAMRRPALIVIDMLNDFLQSWAPDARERLLQSTNVLVAVMRDHQRPVIWVRQEKSTRRVLAYLRAVVARTMQNRKRERTGIESSIATAPPSGGRIRYLRQFARKLQQFAQNLKTLRIFHGRLFEEARKRSRGGQGAARPPTPAVVGTRLLPRRRDRHIGEAGAIEGAPHRAVDLGIFDKPRRPVAGGRPVLRHRNHDPG